MPETLQRTPINADSYPSLSEYWAKGDLNQEKPPIWEELKDDLNPRWVLTKLLLSLKPGSLIVTNSDDSRSTATVLNLPDGKETINDIAGDPSFSALVNAYNGATEPNLERCELWTPETKASIKAWFFYRQRQRQFRRAEDHQIIPQSERYRGVLLPTAYTIKEFVLDVVNKSTTCVQTQQPELVRI